MGYVFGHKNMNKMRKIMCCRERSNTMAIHDKAVKLKYSRHVKNQQCKSEKLTGKARKW